MKISIIVSSAGATRHDIVATFPNGEIVRYEQAEEKHVERKKREIHNAADQLLDLTSRFGPLHVSWHRSRAKIIYSADGQEVGRIAREHWEEPP